MTLSEARNYLTVVAVGNKIYFAGDINQFNAVTTTVDVYDDAANSWSIFALQEPKAAMATIAVNNKIYWAGGIDANFQDSTGYSWHPTSHVEIKDIITGNSTINCLFEPDEWPWMNGAALKNDTLVFFNGDNYYAAKNKFDIYDIPTGTWSIAELASDMEGVIVAINNVTYLISSNQIWKMQF